MFVYVFVCVCMWGVCGFLWVVANLCFSYVVVGWVVFLAMWGGMG
jgi:hypothetical protein